MPAHRPLAEALESRTLFAVTPYNIQKVQGPVLSQLSSWELTDMNDSAAMVGLFAFGTAYRYSPSGGLSTLLESAWSVADINSGGVAVGTASNSRFDPDGSGTDIAWTGGGGASPVLITEPGGTVPITNGHAIGNDGVVYGSYRGVQSGSNQVAAYFSNGTATLITIDGVLRPTSVILEVAANGTYMGLYRNGGLTSIFRGSGGTATTLVTDVLATQTLKANDDGDYLYITNGARANVNGAIRTFANVGDPATTTKTIFDLNNADWFVGWSNNAASSRAATLWTPTETIDLNTLIPANSGWTLLEAKVINNHNQIAGVGVYQGAYAAFLLTPVDQPLPPTPQPGSGGGGGGIGPGPGNPDSGSGDLIARFGAIDNMTLVPGQKYTVPVTLQNVGGGFAGASSVGVYASVNGTFDNADVMLASVPMSGLGPYYSRNLRATLKVPASLPRGTYRLIAVADIYGQVAETSEVNNAGTSVNVNSNPTYADVKWTVGDVGGKTVRKLTVTNDAGLTATFNLLGPGAAEIDSVGGVYSLNLTGTTGATSLTLHSSAGATVSDITVAGSLRSFKATGNLNLTGGTFDVQTLRNFVAPGFSGDIKLHGVGVPTSFTVGRLNAVNLTTASHLAKLVTNDANLVTLTAPSAGVITSRGNLGLTMSLAGNLAALNVAGLLTPDLTIAGSVGRITAGAVRGGSGIVITGPNLGVFSLRGLADALPAFDSQLTANAVGSITLPTVGTFSDVFIHATFVRRYLRKDGAVRLLNVALPGVQDQSGTYDLTIV